MSDPMRSLLRSGAISKNQADRISKPKPSSEGKPAQTMLRDRSAFLYMEPHPDIPDHAQCGSCENFNDVKGVCRWLSKTDEVDADDSCGLYAQGAPSADIEPTGQYTPEEVGFYDGKVRCQNCNALDARDAKRIHCDLYVQLTRMFPRLFKLDERVKPRGCCNAFAPGKRNPKNFGPYGPIPDPDDPNVGGLIMDVMKK
jgi:hypothetical protein